MTDLQRITEITPAFDKRHPDPSKNYGIGACRLRMILVGPKGAVQFMASTGWYLPQNMRATIESEMKWMREHPSYGVLALSCNGWDVGYHSPTPRYEGQEPMGGDCEYVAGGKCYYDGSGLRAEKWAAILVAEGSDKIWEMLEAEYAELFESEPVPV